MAVNPSPQRRTPFSQVIDPIRSDNNEDDRMRKWKVILGQNEKGGVGKTLMMQAVVAGQIADGDNVLVVDADDGNSGLIRGSGKGSAVALPWATGADALPGWLSSNVATNIDTIAIDCGANLIASGRPVNQFLGELVMQVGEAGGSVNVLAVASPNAPGTVWLVREMRDAYGGYASVRLIQNDQDGSGEFPRSLATLSLPTANFPHISPGIQAARLLKVAPLLDVLQAPPVGYTIAMAIYAECVLKFIEEPAIVDLFGAAAGPAIRALTLRAPGPRAMVVQRLKDASDAALIANAAFLSVRRALHDVANSNRTDLAAVGGAAIAMFDAESAHSRAVR
jgi:hypothetical protein